MSAKLPFMVSPGLIPKILTKIQEARKPDRFTQDFLETKLGFGGGSARAVLPLLKRMGFLNSDGTPTALYDRFRNIETQPAAVAEGIRLAFAELFDRNRYAGDLGKEKLKALIMDVTGAAHDDRTVELSVSTFLKLKEMADFEASLPLLASGTAHDGAGSTVVEIPKSHPLIPGSGRGAHPAAEREEVGLNLAYTINLVLPETTNPEVFNTIFKSLRENLLKKS
jgi:hypothetical protein